MKARIYETQPGHVTAEYDEEYGDRVERDFMCPNGGGYVREWDGRDWQQVCNGLAGRGPTLYCSDRDGLLSLIRREYRAMRRSEKNL